MSAAASRCPQCGRPVVASGKGDGGLCEVCTDAAVAAAEAEVMISHARPPRGQAVIVAEEPVPGATLPMESPLVGLKASPLPPPPGTAPRFMPGGSPTAALPAITRGPKPPDDDDGVAYIIDEGEARPFAKTMMGQAPAGATAPAPPPAPGARRGPAVVLAAEAPRLPSKTLAMDAPVAVRLDEPLFAPVAVAAPLPPPPPHAAHAPLPPPPPHAAHAPLPPPAAAPPPHSAPAPAPAPPATPTLSEDVGIAPTLAGTASGVDAAGAAGTAGAAADDGGDGAFIDLSIGGAGRPPTSPLTPVTSGTATLGGGRSQNLYRRYADGQVVTSAGATIPVGSKPPSASVVPVPYRASDVIGQIGDYDLLGELGRGGMGVVYRAYSLRVRRFVAIKVITAGENASDAMILRFQNEAALAARVNHPNIVSVFDMGEDRGLHYFVMELVEGTTLAKMCGSKDPAVRDRAQWTLVKAARAVDSAHKKGVIHRDIKPDNILVSADDEPHITDFGIAKATAEGEAQTGLTAFGQAVGTPNYMPPEQANGELTGIGPWSDVYSLGATLYHVLTGSPPFAGERAMGVLLAVIGKEPEAPAKVAARAKLPRIDLDSETVCLKAMEKETARRYQTAGEFADDLERAMKDEPIKARPIGAAERLQRRLRRNRPLLVGVFVVLSVLFTLAGAFGVVTVDNINRASESLRDKDLDDALNQARTLERAIRVNMLLGRADSARELLAKLAADPDIGYIKVVRTNKTIAYTDLSTRKAVERRLADATVIDEVRDENPTFLDRIEDLRTRAFPNIEKMVRKDEAKFKFDDAIWKSVVDGLKTRSKIVVEDDTKFLYVLRPIKNTEECFVCHGAADDDSYTNNKVRAVLVVKRSQEPVEDVIRENRRATLTIGAGTVGVFLVLILIFYKVLGLGVPKRKFASG